MHKRVKAKLAATGMSFQDLIADAVAKADKAPAGHFLDGFIEGAAQNVSPFESLGKERQKLLSDIAELIQANATFEASIRAQVAAVRHVTPKPASKPEAKRKAS